MSMMSVMDQSCIGFTDAYDSKKTLRSTLHLHLAAALNRPLALVAELSTERDPYASMRHWTFELEGLLELRAQLSEHDIPLDIYVESDDRPRLSVPRDSRARPDFWLPKTYQLPVRELFGRS